MSRTQSVMALMAALAAPHGAAEPAYHTQPNPQPMSDDLIDRVAADLAEGRSIDWPAMMAAAETPHDRRRLESLRVADQIRKNAVDVTVTVTDDTTLPWDPSQRGASPRTIQGRWGRYGLLHEAGSGSFGTVYRAVDPNLNLDVAIKVLHRHVDNELLRQQLIEEGRALAHIRHENVIRVHGVEFDGASAGLCTEFIEGETLETEVRAHGTFSQAQAVEIGEAICQALSAVHRAGFIHRDVKARNVMRERDTGRIVLMDFGTGRELERENAEPTAGLSGTAIYMAPEVLDHQRASAASDVYSVGVLLYFILTGAYPVEATSLEGLRAAHHRGLRTPLGDRRPDLPPRFVRVVEKALAPKSSRYATPAVLSGALEAVRTERPRWIQPVKAAATAAVIGLPALVVLGLINTYYFNAALGRAGFVDEGLLQWLRWGAKGVVAPLVTGAFLVLVVTLLIECLHLLARLSATVRSWKQRSELLIHRWSLDDAAVLASVAFLSSAALVFAAWWYFIPLLGTLANVTAPDISTAPVEKLRLLSPESSDYRLSYRKTFTATTLACIMLWYPALRRAVRTRQQIPRRSKIGGSIVVAFSLLLLDFPYRLFTQDVYFDEVTWGNATCHVLGARGDQRLLFCPSEGVPRNHTVPASDVTPLNKPKVGLTDEGPEVKRKYSIFRFLN